MIKDRPSGYKYVCLQELLEKLPAVKEGKILADKMIVNCGNCGNWWPEKVFKVVAEQMVMEMVPFCPCPYFTQCFAKKLCPCTCSLRCYSSNINGKGKGNV